MYSVALSGLSFVNALVPGVKTPVCGLSRLDFVDLWFGAFPRTAINNYTLTLPELRYNMIIRKNTLWKEVRVLVAISPCTCPHKSVYLFA